jgi:hypothetical protein
VKSPCRIADPRLPGRNIAGYNGTRSNHSPIADGEGLLTAPDDDAMRSDDDVVANDDLELTPDHRFAREGYVLVDPASVSDHDLRMHRHSEVIVFEDQVLSDLYLRRKKGMIKEEIEPIVDPGWQAESGPVQKRERSQRRRCSGRIGSYESRFRNRRRAFRQRRRSPSNSRAGRQLMKGVKAASCG